LSVHASALTGRCKENRHHRSNAMDVTRQLPLTLVAAGLAQDEIIDAGDQ
jgi:hypothetical protein